MGPVLRELLCVGVACVACLPADPPGFQRDAGRSVRHAGGTKTKANVKHADATAVRTQSTPVAADAAPHVLDEALNEDFNRPELGPDWNATSSAWHLEEGRLCVKGAKNHPAWLNRRLPKNAHIEFDATPGSPEGDIKAEAWGDGHSVPAGATYDDATSYIVILGGWKNRFNVLARVNEHGQNRKELRLLPGSEDPRTTPIVEGRSYHVEIERDDGRTVRVTVDETLLFEFEDPVPLVGADHEHFAFNDWNVPVCFDDLLVTPLPD
jgi:hypothetical protein